MTRLSKLIFPKKIFIISLLCPLFTGRGLAKDHKPSFNTMNNSKSNEILSILRGNSKEFNIAFDENITLIMGTFDSEKSEAVEFLYGPNNVPHTLEKAPRLFIVKKTENIFYEYPAFKDTDGSMSFSSDQMLFHNMLLKQARNVKYILMTAYERYLPNFEYNLKTLIRHAHNVIPNITKHHSNIGLIFTRVNYKNELRGDLSELIPRDEVIEMIRHRVYDIFTFMRKGNWQTNSYPSQERFKETLRFLRMILDKINETDSKISTLGIGEARLHIRDRPELRRFISKIGFSNSQGSLISNEIKQLSISVAKEINNDVQSSVEEIGKKMIENTKFDSKTMDLDRDMSKFKNFKEIFSKLKDENVTNIKDLIIKIVGIAKETDMENVGSIIRNIFDNKDVMDDLESFTGSALVKPSQWLKGLDHYMIHLHELEKIGSFMKVVYEHLPQYITEFNINIDNLISNIFGMITDYRRKTMKIHEIGFDEIFKIVKPKLTKREAVERTDTLIKIHDEVKNMDIDRNKALALARTISKCDFKTKVSCPGENKMEILGLVINATELKKHISESCGSRVKHIEVFALQKFIFDVDLNYTGNATILAIIAIEWEIREKRRILLDGTNGEKFKKDPKTPKGNGTHGLPGRPGGPGGHFFGIVQQATGKGSLLISTNGGDGGCGEDGGNGANGEDGHLPKSFNFERFVDRAYIWNRTSHIFPDEDGKTFYEVEHICDILKITDYWALKGTRGEPGKDGGNGGAPGLSGKEGSASVIQLTHDSKRINVLKNKGKLGSNGEGGQGGKGGRAGGLMKLSCGPEGFSYTCKIEENSTSGLFLVAKDGEDGKNGINDQGIFQPNDPPDYKPYTTINRFKAVVRENLPEIINKIQLRQFVISLDTNKDIIELYNYTALIEELKSMEEHFHLLHKTVDFLPYYESLLERIKKYKPEGDKDGNLALISLHAATFSKVCSLRNNVTRFMIVDVQYFLSRLVEDIKVLEKLGKELMVSNYEKEFNKEIDKEIKNANNIIENKFTPQIDRLLNEIKNQINKGLQEWDTMQKKAKVDNEENELKKKFSGPNRLKQALNLIKEVSANVKKVQKYTGYAHSMVSSNGESQVQKLGEITKGWADQGVEHLKKNLLEKSGCLKQKMKEINSGITQHMQKLINKYEQNLNEDVDRAQLDNIHSNAIKEISKYLKNAKDSKASPKDVESIEFGLAGMIHIDENCFHFTNNFPRHKATLELSLQGMLSTEGARAAINKVTQEVDEFGKATAKFLNDMEGKNEANIITISHKLKTLFEGVKFEVSKLLKGLEVEKEVDHTFSCLMDVINGISDIHAKISNQKDQKRLGNLITSMASSRNVWDVSNKALYNTLNDLTFTMKASGLLVQFDRALDAMKQYVFPYADFFLEEFASPPNIELGNDFKDILYTVIPQIENLHASLDEWTKSINRHDKYTYRNVEFTDHYYEPFYTFKYKDFNATIKDLLAGKEILLIPDVRSGVNKNAVKFNKISINLKLIDSKKQNEFNNALNKYDVEMTHYGNNYFKCGEKYFVIRGEKQLISYSFEENIDGKPLKTNVVYDKISSSGYILSPYAFWNVKFFNVAGTTDPLKRFLDEPMDLLLEGRGQYIEMNDELDQICEGNLQKYYTEFEKHAKYDEILYKL